jgi:hypothetical protein
VAGADETRAAPGENVEGTSQASTMPSRISTAAEALAAYQRGQTALRNGDWAAYGEAQAELERVLESLAQATPVPGSGNIGTIPESAATPTP